MVKIAVIGWYGTETIGDRAILSGIINLISSEYGDFECKLGSFNTTLSERTILEDYEHFCASANKDQILISIFDSSRVSELNEAIKWADILILGGGPLMDSIPQLHMIDYAFKVARRKRTKTIVFGCGIGHLVQKEYINSTLSIISNSDLTIFRDSKSISLYNQLSEKATSDCLVSIDPAVFAADVFNKQNKGKKRENKSIVLNFREILLDTYLGVTTEQIFSLFKKLLTDLASNESNYLHLVPMHTFRVGGDDRYLLNELANSVNMPNIYVQNKPLSLEETMSVYYHSQYCIGMRFHAILLQTVLNGKNYIFDYTDAKNGKIINIINQFGAYDVYESRYYSLLEPSGEVFSPQEDVARYTLEESKIEDFRKIYIEGLKTIL